jgi:tryptophan-rich sensory protein
MSKSRKVALLLLSFSMFWSAFAGAQESRPEWK